MTKLIKLQLDITKAEITSDYIFDTIFKISKKSMNLNHSTIAKELMKLAAKRGDEGLYDQDWKECIERFKIPQHVYFYIIKRLKDVGMLRKSRGKFYVLYDFFDHLDDMSTIGGRFYKDLGIIRRKN